MILSSKAVEPNLSIAIRTEIATIESALTVDSFCLQKLCGKKFKRLKIRLFKNY